MNTEDELALLAAEEASLQFSSFNTDTAWEIGSELKAEAERRGVAVSIDIQLAGHTLFHYAMRGTSPDGSAENAMWSIAFTKALMPSAYAYSNATPR